MNNNLDKRSNAPSDLPVVLSKYVDRLEAALHLSIPEAVISLYQSVRYHMGWVDQAGEPVSGGIGKRLRPTLCLMACEAVGGLPEEAIPAAVALELIHNFSLVHDDIQDQDAERHGRPTVWSLFGESNALNVGDTLYVLGYKTLIEAAQFSNTKAINLRVFERLTQSVLDLVEGQYLDLEFEKRLDVTTEEYLDMSMRKTGALIVCATEVGAIIGSGDSAVSSILARTGWYTGQLFQIRDDVLGIWGDSAATGKAVNSDIWRRKKTFPVVHAIQHASGTAATVMRMLYEKACLSDVDVGQVLDVLDSTGARKEAEILSVRLAEQAVDTIRKADISPKRVSDFEDLVSFLLVRGR